VFSDGQEDKNEIWPIDHYFKDLLLIIHQIGYWTGQKYRKLICGDFEHHDTSPYQRRPNYFSFLEEAENVIEEKGETLNKRFCEPGQIGNLRFKKKKNDFLRPVVSLKNRFLDHAQVAFSVGKGTKSVSKESEYYIAGSGEHRNHRFPDIAQVAFLVM
jgi:hypothetical protein